MGVKVRYWDGCWWIAIYHHGKRRMKKCGDRQSAENLARAAREKLARNDLRLDSPASAEYFEVYAAQWLKAAALTLKPSTHGFYSGHVERHLLPTFKGRPVSSIRRADCRLLVQSLRAKSLKVNTVRGVLRTLSTILSQAVDDELLPANPALRLGKHLRSVDDASAVNPFTHDEVTHLLIVASAKHPDLYPWTLTALRTGMRAGELLGLHWGDINWRGRYVQVQRNLVRGVLTTPKNHQQRRVDLSRQLVVQLRLHRRREARAYLKRGRSLPDWVFASVTGSQLDESNVRKAFNRLLRAADLDERGPHQMRHTFASLLLANGAPITYVSQQLGHKDAAITLRVYAHWLPMVSDARLVDVLDETAARGSQAAVAPPAGLGSGDISPLSALVSRVGIEPTTRRLRGSGSSKNAQRTGT